MLLKRTSYDCNLGKDAKNRFDVVYLLRLGRLTFCAISVYFPSVFNKAGPAFNFLFVLNPLNWAQYRGIFPKILLLLLFCINLHNIHFLSLTLHILWFEKTLYLEMCIQFLDFYPDTCIVKSTCRQVIKYSFICLSSILCFYNFWRNNW